MEMLDQEIMRLKHRMTELAEKIIPEFEHKTEVLYAQIMTMEKGSDERTRLEDEFGRLSKELRLRSDELNNARMQIENLETQKSFRR